MKILIIGNYLLAYQQSMHRFAELLVRGLRERGHDVQLLRPFALFGRLRPYETELGKWLSYIDRFLLFPLLLAWRARHFDVIHIADHANAPYVPWLRRLPHVVTCHDMMAIRSALGEIPGNRTRWTGRRYQRWILWGLSRAQSVICVSSQTLREFRARIETKSVLSMCVANALNYPYSPMPETERQPRLQRLGIADVPYILHVGSNSWYKNRQGLIQIFDALRVHSMFANHRLVIVGRPLETESRQWLTTHDLVETCLETGPVDNEDLRALYSGADLLLFPSLQEGFGWPIIEAQACGCPVATTNRPPMNDVGGAAAIYFDPSRIEQAADLIAAAWPQRATLIEAGLRNAREYSVERMMDGYLAAYAEVLERRNRGG